MAIRVGIVGLGGIGCNSVAQFPLWGPYQVVGGTDVSPQARARAAQNLGLPVHDTLEDLLRETPPDLIYVATSSFAHVEPVVTALEAGCHVVVEKPMAANLAEADEMMAAAHRTGNLLFVAHNRRGDGDFLTLQHAVQEGLLGDLQMLHSRLYTNSTAPQLDPANWRLDPARAGGGLLDWGPHLLDQVLALIPAPPVRLLARTASLRWDLPVDNYWHVRLWFGNGAVAEVEYHNASPLELPRFYALGDRACALKLGMRGCVGVPGLVHTELVVRDYETGKIELVPDRPSDYGLFWRNLPEVLQGTAEPLVPLDHAYRVMQVIAAAQQSAATENCVSL